MNRTRARSIRAPMTHGFTLVELMVTIFVAAVLMAIAIPSFKHAIQSTQTSAVTNDLLADLKFARTEAVSRGNEVAVSASNNGNWNDGWKVTATLTDGSRETVRRHEALKHNYMLLFTTAGSPGADHVAFNARGSLEKPDSTTCLTISVEQDARQAPRRITLRQSGAISQSTLDQDGSIPPCT